jgi:3-oxoacyl-[acyl-carrier-protein] synthase-1
MTLVPLPRSDVVLLGAGACTHTGVTALQATMTLRADCCLPRESYFVDRDGEAIALCRAEWIGDDLLGEERLIGLAAPALREAATQAARAVGRPLPLLLALPADTEPRSLRLRGDALLAALAARAEVPIDLTRSATLARGRAAGALAANLARSRVQSGEVEAIVVGGVDSYFDADLLEALDEGRRLHTPSCENGFLPGEGAGFVVLARRGRGAPLRPLAQLLSGAAENEPRPYGASEPCHALGMTQAARRVLGGLTERVPWVLSDVVNERHRMHEWTCVAARLHRAFVEGFRHDQPLLTTGDLGAATATTLMAVAATLWTARAAAGDCALLLAHSDGPERGALLLAQEAS